MTPLPWLQNASRILLGGLDDLVFPQDCAICGGEVVAGVFCESCRQELREASEPACRRCAMPVGPWAAVDGGCWACRNRRLGFDAAVALGPYQGPIRHLCLQLKRKRNAWLARWMVEVLLEAKAGVLRELVRPEGALVVPVPLHWRRRWSRGYNQAEALAEPLARRLKLKLVHPLRRVKATPALARMGRVARSEALRKAFRARSRFDLKGRDVLLVDDILTTGATCGEAARVLKQIGAGRVTAVVVGRAEGRN